MDAETFLLPNAFTLPGIVLGLLQSLLPGGGLAAALHLATAAPFPTPELPAWVSSSLGACLGFGCLLVIRLLYGFVRKREGMGFGDLKLAALLGVWLGVAGVALTLVLAVLLAALAGLLLLPFFRKHEEPARLPLGSFLCAAGLLTLFFGQPVLKWYFGFW